MYELVFQNLPAAVLVLDLADRVVLINPAMQALSDCPQGDLVGMAAVDLLRAHPELCALLQTDGNLHTRIRLRQVEAQREYGLSLTALPVIPGEPGGRLLVLHALTGSQNGGPISRADVVWAAENRSRQVAESLLQTMMSISSNLDHDVIMDQILAQLRQVLPYYTAAVYLVGEAELQLERTLQLERVVGPEAISGRSYTTPRRFDQIWQVYQEQQARIFLSAHSRKIEGSADQVEPVYCSMAAPLISASERLGVLTIDRFDVQPFVQDEVEILQAFANQAAIALRNARLYQQAQEMAVLQERNRLAQELHDAVSQTLFTASILAEAVPKVMQHDPEQGHQGLEEIQRLTRSALAEMRTLLLELRPRALLEKPLGDLLAQLARATSGRLRIPITVQVEGDAILPPQVQVAFYRITQEAFSNIAKHAGASQVAVRLDAGPDQAQLSIRDDGRGFEIDEVPAGHLGLEIMRSRAEEIGADLLVVSRLSAGARIEVNWTR